MIGARNAAQLADNLAAAQFELNDKQMSRLNAVSAPQPGFSAGLTAPAIRRMVFGGHEVSGWLEQ